MTAAPKAAMDRNGEVIADFSMTMHNLGLQRAADELVRMLDAGYWQKFVQAFQTFEFLPGEFDYFLTSQAITRDQVMAIRDIEAKARLEEAMDERKTGEPGYRRPIEQVRVEVPQIPGRIIEPFAIRESDLKVLVNGTAGGRQYKARPPLGDRVRRLRESGTQRKPSDDNAEWNRAVRFVTRLGDEEQKAFMHDVKKRRKR